MGATYPGRGRRSPAGAKAAENNPELAIVIDECRNTKVAGSRNGDHGEKGVATGFKKAPLTGEIQSGQQTLC